jgi:hypothetical protein
LWSPRWQPAKGVYLVACLPQMFIRVIPILQEIFGELLQVDGELVLLQLTSGFGFGVTYKKTGNYHVFSEQISEHKAHPGNLARKYC